MMLQICAVMTSLKPEAVGGRPSEDASACQNFNEVVIPAVFFDDCGESLGFPPQVVVFAQWIGLIIQNPQETADRQQDVTHIHFFCRLHAL